LPQKELYDTSTVYIVLILGLATTPDPFVMFSPAEGVQLNVFPPEARSVVFWPRQIDTLSEITGVITGTTITE
jgi:hypothetical protein